jgi:hypothetical protein
VDRLAKGIAASVHRESYEGPLLAYGLAGNDVKDVEIEVQGAHVPAKMGENVFWLSTDAGIADVGSIRITKTDGTIVGIPVQSSFGDDRGR